MTIQELIIFLNSLEDKTKPVFIYTGEDIQKLNSEMFDLYLTDRVDINIDHPRFIIWE